MRQTGNVKKRKKTSVPERFNAALKDKNRSHLDRAADYVKNHYAEDPNLEKLAALAHFSKFHFHRVFRETFGETPRDCIRRIRLEKSAFKLMAGKQSTVDQV